MDDYEVNQKLGQEPQRTQWTVTSPTGKTFQVVASEWFVKTYYGTWTYKKDNEGKEQGQ